MVSNAIWFWSLFIVLIPSFICLLFVLYNLLFDRTLRHAPNNHIIIVILIIDLITLMTTYPWMIYFYYKNGVIWERSMNFCEFWAFIDWGLFTTHMIFFAWATIERHILIFHDKWVSTRKKRFFVHYLPIIGLLLYCLLYYIIAIFFPPCQNIHLNFHKICINPCMYDIYIFVMYDSVVHQIVPTCIAVIFSLALFLRVLWQKHRVHQPIQWRKYRKMTIQLLSIALLYFIFLFPFTVATILSLCDVVSEAIYDFYLYAAFFSYFMLPLFPFVCALSLPELRSKLINILHLRRPARRIGVETLAMRTAMNRQMRDR